MPLQVGQTIPITSFTDLENNVVSASDSRLTHIQFRRFAGCPFCNLHLQTFVKKASKLSSAGINEVVFMHSTPDEIRQYGRSDVPFHVIPDPEKRVYTAFGVQVASSFSAFMKLGVFANAFSAIRNAGPAPKGEPTGGKLGLPADFLVDGNGKIVALKYGTHPYDQWTVEEVVAQAAKVRV